MDELLPRLRSVPYYQRRFAALFPDAGLTAQTLALAIAAFERNIISTNSPFDRYLQGNLAAMDQSAIQGMRLFEGKARCVLCHGGSNFTDNGFHNIGINNGDQGRSKIQAGSINYGAFKTPGLRNVILTGPYMHDGSLQSLEAVIRYYNTGGNMARNLDPLMQPLKLTEEEVFDLLAFLGSINNPVTIQRPQIP
ncbi:MAG: hypothetical protein COB67_06175 [SAR324 cluster bacterium]|uniref:Cytochrome c domain-containing protein n=1 Tax=SAR324 cluster bacterium TaxID=2024889 RepID=A0A2A4T674_9DELT|nr:MAG: hypothetical protein COB67_06175 [SAR324 cluster bacterium]